MLTRRVASSVFLHRPSPALHRIIIIPCQHRQRSTRLLYDPVHYPHPRLTSVTVPQRRCFHITRRTNKGLQPDSSDPAPPQQHAPPPASQPADITLDEYHEIADEYIDELVLALEDKADKGQSGYDVEYSVKKAGVLTVNTPRGTYVLNKQPPNRQIWISSPVSGPKRYDWVLMKGEGQDQKEGTGMEVEGDLRGGQWVYARDGSSLTELLKKELGVQRNAGGDDEGGF